MVIMVYGDEWYNDYLDDYVDDNYDFYDNFD